MFRFEAYVIKNVVPKAIMALKRIELAGTVCTTTDAERIAKADIPPTTAASSRAAGIGSFGDGHGLSTVGFVDVMFNIIT